MGSSAGQPHFVLFPFMAQGHIIPLVDIGRLLAKHDVNVTIITTPHNASRIQKTVARTAESGHSIQLLQVQFPCKEAGLAEGCENLDMVSSKDELYKFFTAISKMEEAVQELFDTLTPRPNCIISDFCLPYTKKIADKFQIPRISFHPACCFFLLCQCNIFSSNILDTITSDSENLVVPNMPDDDKVEFTKVQIVGIWDYEASKENFGPLVEAEYASYGVVLNTFEELEPLYAKEYRKARNGKVWCIGPVTLGLKDDQLDMAQRGNEAAINEQKCLKWLDSQETSSVIYACLGSLSNIKLPQLKELGLGLEASNKPFIWVIRGNHVLKDVEKWMKEDGFEERTKGRGLVILGWAPQVLILSHSAVGGFLTHCGWNSTIEGVTAGLPLITWPLFSDQFGNAKFVVEKLKTGVSLGVEKPMSFWDVEENAEITVNKEDVKNAVEKLMDEGGEATERRKRAKEFKEKGKKAVEVGGSSYLNIKMLIQDIMHMHAAVP